MESNPIDNVSSREQLGSQLTGSKVYHYPKLWHLRISVVEAENIMPGHRGAEVVRFPEFVTKVQLEIYLMRTAVAAPGTTRSFSNPFWNEDFSFIIDEPFVKSLQVSVVDRMGMEWGNQIVVATGELPMATILKQAYESPVASSWFDLKTHFREADDNEVSTRFVPRIHLQFLLEEASMNNCDEIVQGPAVTTLWKPLIGVLELQILNAKGLLPVQTRDSGVFCVAKVVKNNIHIGYSDLLLGKVRIRLSTLENDRVYIHSYPLLTLCLSGLKRTGGLLLSIRLSCLSWANTLLIHTMPLLLPKVHYADRMLKPQHSILTSQARSLLSLRMSEEEPPLDRKVGYQLFDFDFGIALWSIRKNKTNFFRLEAAISGFIAMCDHHLEEIQEWEKPVHSALFLVIFLTLIMMLPRLIIPSFFLYMVIVGLVNYRYRPRHPPTMDAEFSHADSTDPDEFDTFPTSRPIHIVAMRYDRLRSIAEDIQTAAGDLASLLEQFQALVSWTDPRASYLFLAFCLVAALVSYVVPIRVVIAVLGLYRLTLPLFRSKLPPAAQNFFERLPSKVDTLL
ncbi:hypothetical protein PIB30_000395 [Stylosanthes scabra]|uniref:C2 domain-containing protein n=1 Tax=Stylosanthes scabra TaxID=79078 RepID=A0ABU6U4A8_9FABA|nr:hypothetical protein [Stylosanthes scabra]